MSDKIPEMLEQLKTIKVELRELEQFMDEEEVCGIELVEDIYEALCSLECSLLDDLEDEGDEE